MCHDLRGTVALEYDNLPFPDISEREPLRLPEAPYIKAMMREEILTIRADAILPFAIKGPAHYLLGELDTALSRLLRERDRIPPIFTGPCAVLFWHHYDQQGRHFARRQLRDFDNVEHRAVLNTLSRYCLWDDGPCNIILMDALMLGNRDFTEILVMPIERFTAYLMSENRLFLFQNAKE